MEDKTRLLWLDVLKGIAIVLVIIGHGPVISDHLYGFIWSFHMPLFFCIAGYTFKKYENKKQFLKNKFRRLMKPYFFTAGMLMICAVLRYIVSDGFNLKETGRIIFRWGWAGIYGSCWSYETPFPIYDIGAIWFLCALFCSVVIFNEILCLKEYLIPVTVLILAYIGIETRVHIWLPGGVQSGLTMLVFLYAGYLARENKWLEVKPHFMIHYIMISIGVICIWKQSMAIVGNNSYTFGWLTIAGAACISFYVAVLVRMLFRRENLIAKIFAFWGRNSLIIMCFHLIELDFMPWTKYFSFFADERANAVLIVGMKLLFASFMVFIVKKTALLKYIFD